MWLNVCGSPYAARRSNRSFIVLTKPPLVARICYEGTASMLTRKQHELLIFIDRHLKETGFSPSFEEMKEALKLKSKSGIHRLISALEERGFLRRRHNRARALEVARLPDDRPGARLSLAESQEGFGQAATDQSAFSAPSNFSPNVIRGDCTGRLPGVRAANDAAAVQLP